MSQFTETNDDYVIISSGGPGGRTVARATARGVEQLVQDRAASEIIVVCDDDGGRRYGPGGPLESARVPLKLCKLLAALAASSNGGLRRREVMAALDVDSLDDALPSEDERDPDKEARRVKDMWRGPARKLLDLVDPKPERGGRGRRNRYAYFSWNPGTTTGFAVSFNPPENVCLTVIFRYHLFPEYRAPRSHKRLPPRHTQSDLVDELEADVAVATVAAMRVEATFTPLDRAMLRTAGFACMRLTVANNGHADLRLDRLQWLYKVPHSRTRSVSRAEIPGVIEYRELAGMGQVERAGSVALRHDGEYWWLPPGSRWRGTIRFSCATGLAETVQPELLAYVALPGGNETYGVPAYQADEADLTPSD